MKMMQLKSHTLGLERIQFRCRQTMNGVSACIGSILELFEVVKWRIVRL